MTEERNDFVIQVPESVPASTSLKDMTEKESELPVMIISEAHEPRKPMSPPFQRLQKKFPSLKKLDSSLRNLAKRRFATTISFADVSRRLTARKKCHNRW